MTATATIDGDYILGKCEWCGDETTVYRDNMHCEECGADTVACNICGELQHCDSRCRHVFQTEDLNWSGSGVGEPDETIKRAFLALLRLMPRGFASDLKTAIDSGRFHTFIVAPLIGSGGMMTMTGMPERDGKNMLLAWGDAVIEIGEGPHGEETADGYHWLASLYEGDTPEANRATTAWIDEWIASVDAE